MGSAKKSADTGIAKNKVGAKKSSGKLETLLKPTRRDDATKKTLAEKILKDTTKRGGGKGAVKDTTERRGGMDVANTATPSQKRSLPVEYEDSSHSTDVKRQRKDDVTPPTRRPQRRKEPADITPSTRRKETWMRNQGRKSASSPSYLDNRVPAPAPADTTTGEVVDLPTMRDYEEERKDIFGVQ